MGSCAARGIQGGPGPHSVGHQYRLQRSTGSGQHLRGVGVSKSCVGLLTECWLNIGSYLITVQEFPPKLRITGRWRFIHIDDSMHVLTRCDGLLQGNQLLA